MILHLKIGVAFIILAICSSLAAGDPLPMGIYRFKSDVTKREYNLFVTESASIFGPVAIVAEIPSPEVSFVTHVDFWSGIWNSENKKFFAEGSNRRFANSVEVIFGGENQVQGSFTTTNAKFTQEFVGRTVGSISFSGKRVSTEQDLIEEAEKNSILNSGTVHEAEGVYEGVGPEGMHLALSLRSYDKGGRRSWIASIDAGAYVSVPLTCVSESRGLLRFVRVPAALASDISGLTATIVKVPGGTELHGLYFVPRNGSLVSIRLTKTNSVD